MGDDLAFFSAVRLAELVRSREVSPTELVEAALARIERIDPLLNCFRVVLADRALAEAQQAEARLKAGDDRPLLGVPIALKDGHDLAGELTTHGTDAFPEPAAGDALMVERLRGAGAVIVGKTHLPELAIHGFTESATWGVTRNPWNLQRAPGGSSGGSAAAVAAGMVPLASASDGAGSIRFPASSCGLFGLKPQRGRIPLVPGSLGREGAHWLGLSVNGCLSRTVLDTALYLDVTSGGSRERGAPPPPGRPFVEAAQARPGRLRIAWSAKPPRALAPPIITDEVKEKLAETAELLTSLGHDVAQQDPEWGTVGNHVVPRFLRGIAEDVEDTPQPERLERRTRGFQRLAKLSPDPILRWALGAEEADRRRINAIFERFDVLMTPMMGRSAVEVRRWEGRGALWTLLGMGRVYPFGIAWNHLGNPAAAIPAGRGADGMPLAVQIVGRPADEATLLSLAAQLEAERPWTGDHAPIS